MDVEKFNVLAALVREARAKDRETFAEHEAAQSRWKAANQILTERMKVFDDFVAQQKGEAIATRENTDGPD